MPVIREALEQVVDTFVRAIDAISRFVLLAYQETKPLRSEWREELFARERRIQSLLAEMIRYGVEQGIFSPDHVTIKAHSIMMLAHPWAVRHWAVKEVESVDGYCAILKDLVLGMLTVGAEKRRKAERPRSPEKPVDELPE